MGLKFKRDDSLDRRLDDFAILPELDIDKDEKKAAADIERFLHPEKKTEKESAKDKQEK